MAVPSKEMLLRQITQASFIVDDVRLYLDTHVNDMTAQRFYLEYCTLRNQLLQEYTYHYGPLKPDVMYLDNHWSWIENPWPWEGSE